jgi:D-aminoacyl-tRNA deacylase
MLALLQRVREARVEVAGETVGAIGPGLLMLVCAEPADNEAVAARLVAKVLKLRIFADDAGKMNRCLADVGGGLLVVSQFTLAADTSGGNRPSFSAAAPPEQGRALYEAVLRLARAAHAAAGVQAVQGGRFGADMCVHLINDGPVTIPLTVR